MRELAVFYHPRYRYYTYYQTSCHPQCLKCGTQEAIYMVRMYHTEFMRMSCDERDEFLPKGILKINPSLITRLTEPHRRYSSWETTAEMNNITMNLDIENRVPSDTVRWMYDTIQELMREKWESGRDKVPVCGACRDRQPLERSMGEAVEAEQAETACSKVAAADVSRTIASEKGQEE